ncbi:MAG: MFS transporter [Calditrichaeota bacterium]|nr:MFS transporter [Calditrichota bacterium]
MKNFDQPSGHILPIIVIAQFLCTSTWLAGNAVVHDLMLAYDLDISVMGHITSAVQFGFISGTLFFAALTIADRYAPSKVFFASAFSAAVFNGSVIFGHQSFFTILIFRFLTGFFLAGIYPVGMKIASDYYKKGLGHALGYLVGALVIGSAFPHLVKSFSGGMPWKDVLTVTSGFSATGGLLMILFIKDGPYRKKNSSLNLTAFLNVFQYKTFRSAAFGYFGHMWELYTFYAFIPLIIMTYLKEHPGVAINTSQWTFFIIGIGGLACIGGGYISRKIGSLKTARSALSLSGICCLFFPFIFGLPETMFQLYLLFWGMMVVADSPQFSTLVAQNAPDEIRGTAMTIVNCIGFAITIISIEIITFLLDYITPQYIMLFLAIGPFLGTLALKQPGIEKYHA